MVKMYMQQEKIQRLLNRRLRHKLLCNDSTAKWLEDLSYLFLSIDDIVNQNDEITEKEYTIRIIGSLTNGPKFELDYMQQHFIHKALATASIKSASNIMLPIWRTMIEGVNTEILDSTDIGNRLEYAATMIEFSNLLYSNKSEKAKKLLRKCDLFYKENLPTKVVIWLKS